MLLCVRTLTHIYIYPFSLSLSLFLVNSHTTPTYSYVAQSESDDGELTWFQASNLENEPISTRYLTAIYWSITTITTVGFGDVIPISQAEKAYCVVAVAIGAVVYGSVISSFVASAATRNIRRSQLNERLDAVVAYMRYKRFPAGLFKRVFKYAISLSSCERSPTHTHTHTHIHRYFHHYYDHTTSFDEAQILRELSEQLRIEVSSFMAYQTFHEVRLFRRYNVKYLTVILLSAKPVRIQQGEVIFRAGKIGTEMYIITTGRVRSYFKTETERAELQDKTSGRVLTTNDTFGELVCSHSLFLSLSHSHTHTHIPSRIQKPKRSAPSVYRTKDKRQLFRRQ